LALGMRVIGENTIKARMEGIFLSNLGYSHANGEFSFRNRQGDFKTAFQCLLVKPDGEEKLYVDFSVDIETVEEFKADFALFTPYGSVIATAKWNEVAAQVNIGDVTSFLGLNYTREESGNFKYLIESTTTFDISTSNEEKLTYLGVIRLWPQRVTVSVDRNDQEMIQIEINKETKTFNLNSKHEDHFLIIDAGLEGNLPLNYKIHFLIKSSHPKLTQFSFLISQNLSQNLQQGELSFIYNEFYFNNTDRMENNGTLIRHESLSITNIPWIGYR